MTEPKATQTIVAAQQHSGRFSIIPARAIDDRNLGKGSLAVLCALGSYADRDGWCWPSIETIAERLAISRRQVVRCLRELEKLNYLETQKRFDNLGRQQSCLYRIRYDTGQAKSSEIVLGESDTGRHTGESTFSRHIANDLTGKAGDDTRRHPGDDIGRHPRETSQNRNSTKDLFGDCRCDTGRHPNVDPIERRYSVGFAENQFEEFWQEYPSRSPHSNPKKPALQKFKHVLKHGINTAEIIRGARNYRLCVEQERIAPKFVAQAVTWLNQERWAEYQKIEAVEVQGIAPL